MALNTAQRIAKNTLALLGSEVVVRALTFMITLFIARRLGAQSFGQYSFALAFVALFMVFGDMGMGTLTTRNVAREKGLVNKYVDNLLLVKVLLGLLTFGLIFLIMQFMGKTAEVKLLVYTAAAWLVIDSINLLIKAIFNAFEVMEYVAAVTILEKVFYFAFCALILFTDIFQKKLLLLVAAYPVSSALALVCGLFILRRRITRISLEIDWGFWKSVIKEGWPFAASGLFAGLYFSIDIVILSQLKSDEIVGWYSAAYKIFLILYALQSFYFQALFPVASRFYKESAESFRKLLNRSGRLILSYTIPLAVGGIVLAPSIVHLVYTSKYIYSVTALQILLLNLITRGITGLYNNILSASGQQKNYMYGFAVGALSNTILNLALIPSFSLGGAAAATVISTVAMAAFCYFKSTKTIHITFKKFMFKPALSSLLMALILVVFIKLNLFVLVVLGMISYTFFMFILRGIADEDMKFLLRTLKLRD